MRRRPSSFYASVPGRCKWCVRQARRARYSPNEARKRYQAMRELAKIHADEFAQLRREA